MHASHASHIRALGAGHLGRGRGALTRGKDTERGRERLRIVRGSESMWPEVMRYVELVTPDRSKLLFSSGMTPIGVSIRNIQSWKIGKPVLFRPDQT